MYQGGVVTAGYMPVRKRRAVGGKGHPYRAGHREGKYWQEGPPEGGHWIGNVYKKGELQGQRFGRVHYESRQNYGEALRNGEMTPAQARYRQAFLRAFPKGGKFQNKADQLNRMQQWGAFWRGLTQEQKNAYALHGINPQRRGLEEKE